jgi:hypothetical protein
MPCLGGGVGVGGLASVRWHIRSLWPIHNRAIWYGLRSLSSGKQYGDIPTLWGLGKLHIWLKLIWSCVVLWKMTNNYIHLFLSGFGVGCHSHHGEAARWRQELHELYYCIIYIIISMTDIIIFVFLTDGLWNEYPGPVLEQWQDVDGFLTSLKAE